MMTDQQRAEYENLAERKAGTDTGDAISAMLADLEDAERTISRQQTAIDGQVAEINTLKDDLNSLLAKKFSKFNGEECWIWQGDGEDHLESLVCPAVIAPADLMAIQAELAAARRQNEELRTQIIELRDLFLRENVRANKECSNNIELRISMQSAIEQAVAPYKRDAERYLALRNGSAICAPAIKPIGRVAVGIPHQPTTESERVLLDAAIDAALSAKEKSNG